jgi:rare lipoprotein A
MTMHRYLRLTFLLMLVGLAGCATRTSPSVPLRATPQQPVAPPPIAAQEPTASPQPSPQQQSSTAEPFFTQAGLASFYGPAHDGKLAANGKNFDHRDLTAAHRTLAFGTLVRITNLANGRTVTVEITDRGPHIKGRVIDISLAAARQIGMQTKGVARVRLEAFQADQPAKH